MIEPRNRRAAPFATMVFVGLGLSLASACPTASGPDGGDGDGDGDGDGGQAQADVVINEVLARNQASLQDEMGQFEDWIEIRNQSEEAIDLAGWTLSDLPDDLTLFTFPAGTTLPGGGYLIVFADNDVTDGPLHAPFRLSGLGESVFLANADGELVDTVTFPLLGADESYGRPNDQGAPALLESPTPGAANTGVRPAVDGGAFDVQVYVNEVVARNSSGLVDEGGAYADWFELYNAGAESVDLEGFYVSDDEAVLKKWRLAEQTQIAAGGYLVFFADGDPQQGGNHVGFRLSGGGESLSLATPTGVLVDTLSFGPQPQDVAYGRAPDGAATSGQLLSPTPGASNTAINPNPVEVDGGPAG